ncbi:MAG: aminotransferase class V-fold PLP-dependent enzyme [Acidimicrobiia bacterium]
MSATRLVEVIRDSVIGEDDIVDGPFGPHRVTYADYTASGRALTFIEDYIRDAVLPLYANTHTESSGTGLQTTRFREEAREIVRRCLGAGPEHVVLFCGSGSTGAIDRLIRVLGLRLSSALDDRYELSGHLPQEQRPVVFIGPYEHHSNELPWRESIADVVTIHEDLDGGVDLDHLEEELIRHADRPLKIGSFSAASNVTGIITDVRSVSVLLHRHNALSLWDFAAAAPYVGIAMGPVEDGTADAALAYKDAIFISPHKLIGGPGTPGLLVARRELFANRVPAVPGGGTVTYVNPTEHRYLADVEHREEGGTPAIIGAIRTGLVFQLKDAVGSETIREREESFIERAIASWSANPNIEILGSERAHRLSIVSFVVRHRGRYLHHNFVVSLLNDLFGIQSRGGCSCAGPYGHRLLGIDLDQSHEFEREIARGCEGIKPGWVRVNFNYFISEQVFEFILDAMHLVAEEGWRLLPYYRFEPETGLWKHRAPPERPPMSLHDISYDDGSMSYETRRRCEPDTKLQGYLGAAKKILADVAELPPPGPFGMPDVTDDFEGLRWFPLPDEVAPSGVTGGDR